jgi:hypothetical protein
LGAFCSVIRFRLSRHGREHIEFAFVVQSANDDLTSTTRRVSSKMPFFGSVCVPLALLLGISQAGTRALFLRSRLLARSVATLFSGQAAEIPRAQPCHL